MASQAGQSGPSAPKGTSVNRRPKKSGFLSFLNCCSAPDDANSLEESQLPSKNITNVDTQKRPTTSSKQGVVGLQTEPSPSTLPIPEKETAGPSSTIDTAEPSQQIDSEITAEKTQPIVQLDQSLPSTNTEIPGNNPSPPAVTIETPVEPTNPNDFSDPPQQSEEDKEKEPADVMPHVPSPPATGSTSAPGAQTLPPPPPREDTNNSQDNSQAGLSNPRGEGQQFLLPPIAPRFRGKKCLVLDLDETLVHSSFKVCGFLDN